MGRLLLIGIVMLPAGVMLIVMAMRGDGVFPQGIWQGPILIVLGLVLIIISVRHLLKGGESTVADQPLPVNGGVDFNAARRLFRDSIRNTIEKILPVDFPNQAVYGFVLATMDDCDHTMVFATSLEALEFRLEGVTDDAERAFQQWYAGEWSDDLGHISFQEGEKILSLDSSVDDSADSRRAFQARRLWVMTKALKDVADEGVFNRGRQPITAFCTMFDDENAVWLERESARYINNPERFDAFAPAQVLAASHWYRNADEPCELAKVFHLLLQQDELHV